METTKSLRQNYRKNPGNGQKLLIKTSFLVVNTCGENSIIEITETAGAAVLFILYFVYNSVGDHIYIYIYRPMNMNLRMCNLGSWFLVPGSYVRIYAHKPLLRY
jgi:hypothetical protein